MANDAKATRAGAVRIAVVDHYELYRLGIALMGQADPANTVVLAVGSGGELLTALRGGLQVDLVILQLDLPVMDGFAVLARLRERHPGVHVLAFARQPADEQVRRAMRQGAATVVEGTATKEEWMKAIRDTALTGHHYSSTVRRQVEAGWKLREAPAEETPKRLPKISPRELEYWKFHCTLKTPTVLRVARRMGISFATARTFRRRLCKKLGVHGSQELLHAGLKAGIATL